MSNNQLMIYQNPEEFKYQFFKDREERTEEITNEQLAAEEKERTNQGINDFFFGGMGGSVDDFLKLYADIEEVKAASTDEVLKFEDIPVEKEDPFLIKVLEADKTVFKRTTIETDPLGGGLKTTTTVPTGSTSNQYVRTDRAATGYGGNGYGGGYASTPAYGSAQTTAPPAGPRPGDQAHLYTQIPRVQANFQNVAMQTPVWSSDERQAGWDKYKKKSWWAKAKEWLKGKKGRIMTKVALLAAMQLGMAWVGKKYAFDNMWQGVAFLSMMLGTFYITKELQSEGFDPRGFGI